MDSLDFNDDESLGKVIAVDTATVTIRVDELERLKRIQVNRLTAVRSSKAGQHLIGIVSRITRKAGDDAAAYRDDEDPEAALPENNLVRVALIGTLIDKEGLKENVFKRTLETVPEIDADCYYLEGQRLTDFMQGISQASGDGPQLDEAIDSVITTYGKSNRNKYRAVVYYMLAKHFKKEAVYG